MWAGDSCLVTWNKSYIFFPVSAEIRWRVCGVCVCVKEAERRKWGGREGDGSMSYGVCKQGSQAPCRGSTALLIHHGSQWLNLHPNISFPAWQLYNFLLGIANTSEMLTCDRKHNRGQGAASPQDGAHQPCALSSFDPTLTDSLVKGTWALESSIGRDSSSQTC